MAHLPLDIIANVVDELSGDISSLRSLCLLCSMVAPFCQRYIFSTIDIQSFHDSEGGISNRRLLILFEAMHLSHHLPTYVRTLRYKLAEDDSRNAVLRSILRKLRHVENFQIRNRNGASHGIDWNTLDSGFIADLFGIIHGDKLATLGFTYLHNIPLSIFSSASQTLKSLSVYYGYFLDDLSNCLIERDHPLQFVNFTCCHSASKSINILLRAIPATVDFSRLKYLAVSWDDDEDVAATESLGRITNKLERLQCRGSNSSLLVFLFTLISSPVAPNISISQLGAKIVGASQKPGITTIAAVRKDRIPRDQFNFLCTRTRASNSNNGDREGVEELKTVVTGRRLALYDVAIEG